MCKMCLKYRIILLIVIKNPWVHLLAYFLLRGAVPYPVGAITSPLRPPAGLLAIFGGFDIPTLHLPFLHLAIIERDPRTFIHVKMAKWFDPVG